MGSHSIAYDHFFFNFVLSRNEFIQNYLDLELLP